MPQQLLDRANVGALHQLVGRERKPQSVQRRMPMDAAGLQRRLERFLHRRGDTCQRNYCPVSSLRRTTLEANANCQPNARDAPGYLRASRPGNGACPHPRS